MKGHEQRKMFFYMYISEDIGYKSLIRLTDQTLILHKALLH